MQKVFKPLLGSVVNFMIKGTNSTYCGVVMEATRFHVVLNIAAARNCPVKVSVKYSEINKESIENLTLQLVK